MSKRFVSNKRNRAHERFIVDLIKSNDKDKTYFYGFQSPFTAIEPTLFRFIASQELLKGRVFMSKPPYFEAIKRICF